MKCCKCKKVATFSSPKAYCAYHWTKWWTQGYEKLMTKTEFKKEFAMVLRMAEGK